MNTNVKRLVLPLLIAVAAVAILYNVQSDCPPDIVLQPANLQSYNKAARFILNIALHAMAPI